ncbi:MAG: RecQ family ATP-dependent DNA helicase [Sphaerochaeta sp.]|nr:RecQ family ATP-dependent DNA helicase [Sphaerochaeta sp.]
MDIHTLAHERFNIPYLRPFQELVIRGIIDEDRPSSHHRPTVVILPTGSGKSLCFMLPALLVEGLVVIVYPLLSLMNDQRRRFERADIPCVQLQGGQSPKTRQHIFSKLEAGVKVVITNAETLSQPQILSQLARHTISLLVLDEAHTIVKWGKGFRPSLAELGPFLRYLPIRQLLLFTATADEEVLTELDRLILYGKQSHLIKASSDRPNISYHTAHTLSKRRAVNTFLAPSSSRPALVFCPTRRLCETMSEHYRIANPTIPTSFYHAGLTREERVEKEGWFMENTEAVLFATNAFGMGVDKSDIRTVIHTYIPQDVLAFLQESGRGGRDGKSCHSLLLLQPPYDHPSPLLPLFDQNQTCIRRLLLEALEEEAVHCSGCDVCDQTISTQREGERAILAPLRFKPLSYTTASLIALLKDDTLRYHHAGHLATWQTSEIAEAIEYLIEEGKIKKCKRSGRLYRPLR